MFEPVDQFIDQQDESLEAVEQACQIYIGLVRKGNEPSIKEFAARYPKLAEEIRDVLPTVMLLEQARSESRQKRRDGRVARGPKSFDSLGDYRILNELGRGGMGIVYEAYQESLDRVVALKVLPRNLMANQKTDKFLAEAKIVAQLHHSNIVPIFTVGRDQGVCYYAMEKLDGNSIDQFIDHDDFELTEPSSSSGNLSGSFSKRKPRQSAHWGNRSGAHSILSASKLDETRQLSIDQIVEIGLQVTSALQYAHDQGVLHRDVKPSNLILTRDGRIWLTDFGLATQIGQPQGKHSSGAVSGTLRYVAPERLEGKPDRPQADVYSLGVSLTELLTGKPAFSANRSTELIRQVINGQMTPLESAGRAIPNDLAHILRCATACDPEARYADAEAFHEDLLRYSLGEPVAANPLGPVKQIWRWYRQNRAVAMLTALAALLLVAVTLVSTISYVRSQEFLRQAEQQRSNANHSTQVAHKAIDRIFEKLNQDVGLVQSGSDTQLAVSDNQQVTDLLRQLTSFYEQLAHNDPGDSPVAVDPVATRRRVGQLHLKLGNHLDAVQAFKSAQRSISQRKRTSPVGAMIDDTIEWAEIENEIGMAYRAAGQDDEALQAHVNAEKVLKQWLENHPTASQLPVKLELARTLYLQSPRATPRWGPEIFPPVLSKDLETVVSKQPLNIERMAKPLQEAIEILETGLPDEIDLDVVAEHNRTLDFRAYDLLAEQLHWLALCYRKSLPDRWSVRTQAQHERHRRSVALLRMVVKQYPYDAAFQFDLARTLAQVDEFAPDMQPETMRAMIEDLKRAVALADSLNERFPNVISYQIESLRANFKLAHLCSRELDQLPDVVTRSQQEQLENLAEQSFRRALRLQLDLVEQKPQSAAYRVWAALIAVRYADCHKFRGHPERRNRLTGEALAILQKPPIDVRQHPSIETILDFARRLGLRSLTAQPEDPG